MCTDVCSHAMVLAKHKYHLTSILPITCQVPDRNINGESDYLHGKNTCGVSSYSENNIMNTNYMSL